MISSSVDKLIWKGSVIALDERGYLQDAALWESELAELLAQRDEITLTADHWRVIEFLREYYIEYTVAPPMRLLVKALAQRYGSELGDSRALYRLFPEGPVKQGARYAGLPRPASCI